MSNIRWQIRISIELIATSIFLYILYYFLSRDILIIENTLIASLAYSPIQVLFVTFFINQILKNREKRIAIKKLHIIIGVFFHEVGIELLKQFNKIDPHTCKRLPFLDINNDWKSKDFNNLIDVIQSREFKIKMTSDKLFEFLGFFEGNKNYFLGLLENPNLIEHELFTDMLWGMFHFYEELKFRKNLIHLPAHDIKHLEADAQRVYKALLIEWINYLKHLKEVYPFLYSFTIRTNPFKAEFKNEDVLIR